MPMKPRHSAETSTFASTRSYLAAGKMYWTDLGNSGAGSGIARANLDGSDRQTLINGGSPTGIALDPATGKLYWANDPGTSAGTGSIHRANLDGTRATTLISGLTTANGLALDLPDG